MGYFEILVPIPIAIGTIGMGNWEIGRINFKISQSRFSQSRQGQLDIPILYDGIRFDEGLRLDILVNDLVIAELKAIDLVNPVWEAQMISHLKLTKRKLGYLINFNVPLIKDGIKRFRN